MNRIKFMVVLVTTSLGLSACGSPGVNKSAKINSKEHRTAFYYAPNIPESFNKDKNFKVDNISNSKIRTTFELDNNQAITIESAYLLPEKSKIYYQKNILKF